MATVNVPMPHRAHDRAASPANPRFLRPQDLTAGMALLLDAGEAVQALLAPSLARLDLSLAQYRLLDHLERAPGIPVGDAQTALGLTKQALNRTMKPLLARDWLAQTPDQRDRRVRRLRLTETGMRALLEVRAPLRQRFTQAYAEAGGEAVAGFRAVLSGLLATGAADQAQAPAPEPIDETPPPRRIAGGR